MSDYPFDLQAALSTAERIARQAGAVLREYYERPRQSNYKRTVIDLVTEADTASEKVVVEALRTAFPDHHIHGEEGGGYGPAPETTPYHWWVDPLDGTTNFAHRFPVFSVSIALSDAELNPILGVVFDPTRDETFKGIRGQGATLNGRPLRVSEVRDLSEAMVVTGFAYDRWTAEDNNTERFAHFVRRTQGARRVGSAALDLSYVAAGRCDMYWEAGPKPWDVQAGLLFVLEAGGSVTDFEGKVSPDAQSGTRIIASNGYIHEQALNVIRLGDDAPRPQSGK
ncbi:MAG: inositol monophosphatase [Chloroflexi bacterium]|nr:inositol monophosphatase [Chloroflexota bacterium]